jgi:pimeloyl-ACP methyl ester carboxylesterase
MRFVTRKNVLLAAAIVVFPVIGFLFYRADRPSPIAPDPAWEDVINRADVTREPTFVQRGRVELEADLLLPQGRSAALPAVIFVAGSGDALYQNYGGGLIEQYVLDVFLPRGIAVLLVNKRGMGQSSGSWLNNDFQGRADDVYAAVQDLQDHPSIDPARIGLIGHSQGGWIVNLVAAQHTDVAFFVSLAGPTTTVEEQMRNTYENVFRCEGSAGEELARRTANQLRLTRVGAAIGRVVPIGVIGFDAGIIEYDPRRALRSVRQPGLYAYGEYDPLVPPDHSRARFEEIFAGQLPSHLTLRTIPQANHRFKVVDSLCTTYEESLHAPFSEDLGHVLEEWLTGIGY